MTEEQLVLDFVAERPEFVESVVAQYLRERLHERREELDAELSRELESQIAAVVQHEQMALLIPADRGQGDGQDRQQTLNEKVEEMTRYEVVSYVRRQREMLDSLQEQIDSLHRWINRDDADWWKNGPADED